MHPCSDGFGGSLFNQATNSRRVLLSFVFRLGVTFYKVVVYAVRIIFYLSLSWVNKMKLSTKASLRH